MPILVREALIKCRKSACLEKLPSEVGDIQGGMPPDMY
jgi:hypothetical protein